MTFELTILGCSSAIPVHGRYLSAQVLNVRESLFLIDCGEGTQFRLTDFKISKNKISTVLISHLHGDHIYGLPGLINSMALSGRVKPLNIYGPVGLDYYINSVFEVSHSHVNFDLRINIIDHNVYSIVYEDDSVQVYAFPLVHRVPTIGYKIIEKDRLKNISVDAIDKYNLNYSQIQAAKYGHDIVLDNGTLLKNNKVTLPSKKLRSYAYCSDTKYDEQLIAYIKGVDLLYHESTYMQNLHDKAVERFHSTTEDAANIAVKAGVGKLVLGHYSSRYKYLESLLKEAKDIFENTELGLDGKKFIVLNEK